MIDERVGACRGIELVVQRATSDTSTNGLGAAEKVRYGGVKRT
jgi:hypothetical protein